MCTSPRRIRRISLWLWGLGLWMMSMWVGSQIKNGSTNRGGRGLRGYNCGNRSRRKDRHC
ncbi:hypothetical protein CC1G_14511 [Coprinopsis cinerea okayama7|uniref:Uncharacterized protein n=1 Tax=Coprinopsis cinerea (strain Okayama-7 / 130 / ATCC MYA-4618 / FGSC 9003) TaxID=240176 RepID=D6RM52_COPC7|nr:hypothetical protein CC1G_14511 [Coprinopsis cinerea okayama7\|eukprot:XP_002911513.1 hypothetical protein CC1G_14511 [Coprinopsis cinerea okayama7\